MKAVKPTWSYDNFWELYAEPGDHKPIIIKLFHNDKWFTYELREDKK